MPAGGLGGLRHLLLSEYSRVGINYPKFARDKLVPRVASCFPVPHRVLLPSRAAAGVWPLNGTNYKYYHYEYYERQRLIIQFVINDCYAGRVAAAISCHRLTRSSGSGRSVGSTRSCGSSGSSGSRQSILLFSILRGFINRAGQCWCWRPGVQTVYKQGSTFPTQSFSYFDTLDK